MNRIGFGIPNTELVNTEPQLFKSTSVLVLASSGQILPTVTESSDVLYGLMHKLK